MGDTHSPRSLGIIGLGPAMSARPRPLMLGLSEAKPSKINALNFLAPNLSSPLPTTLILTSPRRGERAHGQRPMRRRGAIERDWAGGGYSSVSGAFHRWEARPPSASMGTKRVIVWRPAPPSSGFSRKGSRPGPAKP